MMWRLVLAYFMPKRWRGTSCMAVLFAVTLIAFITIVKLRSSPVLDFGPRYEFVDVRLTNDQLGINHCPVCFGRNKSICEGILENTFKLRRKEETVLGDKWKPRAQGLWNKEQISIKHFGNASEFYELDNELCSLVGKINAPCNVQEVVWKSFLNPSSIERALLETMECPSKRLMTKVKQLYFGSNSKGNLSANDTIHLTSTLNLNQEPIIFQLFPSDNGWPFPKFYGACGRAIVIEDAGVPLDSLLSEPWMERAKLALDVIKMAKQLTNNREHWGLYLKETALGNFAVTNRTVKMVDANHILVVDLSDSSTKAESKKAADECDQTDEDCLSFHPNELCQGTVRDQNYYAICRSVLIDIGGKKGLLHTPPDENEFKVLLDEALAECVTARTIRREEASDLIVGLLQSKISSKLES